MPFSKKVKQFKFNAVTENSIDNIKSNIWPYPNKLTQIDTYNDFYSFSQYINREMNTQKLMKFAVVTIGFDNSNNSNNLIKILENKINIINITTNSDHYLYPDELYDAYGKDVKIIFLTKNCAKQNNYFNELYQAYISQKIFDILFIKYELLYFYHIGTLNILNKFINTELSKNNFKFNEHNALLSYPRSIV